MIGPEGEGIWVEPRRFDPNRTWGPIRTPIGPFWALLGPTGPISLFSQFWALGPQPFPGKVSVVAAYEQALPIELKRHGHMLFFFCVGFNGV